MNDLFGVCSRERVGKLPADVEDIRKRQETALFGQATGQGLAFEELHHQIGRAVGKLAKVRDLDEARMVHQIDRSRLIEKTVHELGRACEKGMEHFDGNDTRDALVLCSINDSHAALAELLEDAVWTNAFQKSVAHA